MEGSNSDLNNLSAAQYRKESIQPKQANNSTVAAWKEQRDTAHFDTNR